MRIHYLIHAPFEKLGAIEEWININAYSVTGTHTYLNDLLPDVSQFDMLIIMGGPQSAVALDQYPYLQKEVELTKKAIQANKAVLGICLGAQIIGKALGAKAERSPHKEIGLFPIQLTKEAESDPIFKQFENEFEVMHWHSDMPGISQESVVLASSMGCPRQAFRYGDRVYGFQFHLELTKENIQEMIEHCREDLLPSRYVQTADELLKLNLTSIHQKLHIALDYLASCVK